MADHMKAYIANDKNCDEPYSEVIFAETAGKAKALAANSETFEEYGFTDIRVRRCRALDRFYKGRKEMDWLDMDDRIAMVRYAGFFCSYEMDNPGCHECGAAEYCERYERHKDDWAV